MSKYERKKIIRKEKRKTYNVARTFHYIVYEHLYSYILHKTKKEKKGVQIVRKCVFQRANAFLSSNGLLMIVPTACK